MPAWATQRVTDGAGEAVWLEGDDMHKEYDGPRSAARTRRPDYVDDPG
jgi:hypothetical protein